MEGNPNLRVVYQSHSSKQRPHTFSQYKSQVLIIGLSPILQITKASFGSQKEVQEASY